MAAYLLNKAIWTTTSDRYIISGGQTGVDRAALDAAISLGIQIGGWCPKGRLAEDGEIPERYPLCETESEDYAARTRNNVRDSDATLILIIGLFDQGTHLTRKYVDMLDKQHRIVDIKDMYDSVSILNWLLEKQIFQLNVAGPREGNAPGIYERSYRWLRSLFQTWISTRR